MHSELSPFARLFMVGSTK